MKKKGKNNFLKTLMFQNIAVNGGIIVAMLILITLVTTGMSSMVSTAVTASTNEVDLVYQIEELKMAVSTIDGDVRAEVGAFGGNDEIAKRYADDIVTQQTAIVGYEEYIAQSILVTQTADGQAQYEALATALDSFNSAVATLEQTLKSGDVETVYALLEGGEYSSSLQAVYDCIAACNESTVGLSDGLEAYLNQAKAGVVRKAMAGFVIVLALVALSLLLSHFRNTRVIDSIRKELDSIISNINAGKGDLTARINTKTETEVKAIKDGLNDFIETLQNIIRDVKEGTVVLKTSSEEMTAQIRKASDNVTNSSAALEELSASMDNVATTAAGINDRLVDVKEAVDTINDAAEEGNETARSIKTEAAEIKSEAEEKKANTGAKMEELSSVLEQSVRDSEKVKQINDLTNDILDIASQTNLLALNASIEAARAGEAGKGFAVVADEISSLAANSRETANTIQEISKEVTAAVNTLSKNAQEVLEFINTTVLADYDAFVETGDKYENTSAVIDQMIEKFSERADHLREIMDEMVENVNAITQSVEQSTQAISMSATNSTEIVEEISEIDIAMGKNNDVTEQLNSSADKFEIV